MKSDVKTQSRWAMAGRQFFYMAVAPVLVMSAVAFVAWAFFGHH